MMVESKFSFLFCLGKAYKRHYRRNGDVHRGYFNAHERKFGLVKKKKASSDHIYRLKSSCSPKNQSEITCTGPAALRGPPTPPPMIWPSILDKHTLRPPVRPPNSVRT